MEKKQTKKPTVKKVDVKAVTQSTKEVVFECSKDHKGLKKGVKYNVSENVAEILAAKGLGKVK
jgi:hypothetical protein